MSKKNKQELEQITSTWVRSDKADNEVFRISRKKTTRWFGGSRRAWNSRILNVSLKAYHKLLLLSYFKDIKGVFSPSLKHKSTKNYEERMEEFLMRYPTSTYKLNNILSKFGQTSSISAHKNFCLISGRGRTYNRYLGFGRHNVRKLLASGAVAGLIK